jgi:hypothetical protein
MNGGSRSHGVLFPQAIKEPLPKLSRERKLGGLNYSERIYLISALEFFPWCYMERGLILRVPGV